MSPRAASPLWRRIVGWLMIVPLGVLAAVAVLAGVAVLWLRTESGNNWILTQVTPLIDPPEGTLSVGALRTDLFTHLELDAVALADANGVELVGAESVVVDFHGQSLLARTLPIPRVEIRGLRVAMDSPSQLGALWGPSDPNAGPWKGLPIEIHVAAADIQGTVKIGEWTAENITLTGGVDVVGTRVAWNSVAVSGAVRGLPAEVASTGVWQPSVLLVEHAAAKIGAENANTAQVTGALRGETLAFELSGVHFVRDTLLPLAPQLADVPIAGPLDLAASVTGTLSAPELGFTLTTPGGPLTGAASLVVAEKAWKGAFATTGLDLSGVVDGLEPLGLFGTVEVAGSGYEWPNGLVASVAADLTAEVRGERIRLVGPLAVERGVVTTPEPLSLDAGWARSTAAVTADIVEKHAAITVKSASAQLAPLARYGVPKGQGSASYAGQVEVGWDGPVSVQLDGNIAAKNLDFFNATVQSLAGPVQIEWNGAATGRGQISLTGAQFQGRTAATGNADFTLGETITFQARLAEPDREIAAIDGRFVTSKRKLDLDVLRVEVAPELIIQGKGPQTATLVDGGVANVGVDASIGKAHLTASGGISKAGRDTVVAELTDFELGMLALVKPGSFAGFEGGVTARVGVTGNMDEFITEGEAQISALVLPGQVRGLDVNVAWDAGEQGIDATGEISSAGIEYLNFHLGLPLGLSQQGVTWHPDAPLLVDLVVPPTQLAAWEPLLDGKSLPDLEASAQIKLAGTLNKPTGSLVASANLPISPAGTTVRAWVDGTLEGEELYVRGVVNQAFQSRLELNVGAPFATKKLVSWLQHGGSTPAVNSVLGDIGGAVVLKQLSIATVRRLFDAPYDLDGALSGAFALSGKLTSPRVQGGVNVISARVGPVRVEPATLSITPFGPGYRLEASIGFLAPEPIKAETKVGQLVLATTTPASSRACGSEGSGGSLLIAGYLPLDDTFARDKAGLRLDISGSGVPLSAVEGFTKALRETAGCITMAGNVTGTIAAPEVSVGISLSNGGFSILPIGIRYDDVGLRGRLQAGLLTIDSLYAKNRPLYGGYELRELDAGNGKIEGTAQVQFEGFVPNRIDGKLDLDAAWLIATSDRRAQASGTLVAEGSPKSLAVEGALVVDNAYLNLSERFFSGARGSPLHPDLEIIRPGAQVAATKAGEAPSFSIAVRPKISIDLARHVRLRVAMPLQGAYGDVARSLSTVQVEAELDGMLKIDNKSGQLRLSGEVTPEDARATILGRPFQITEGTIGFTGVDVADPLLDLQATYSSGNYGDINVVITGSARDPELSFSSDELSQDDVLAVLVVGAPISELGKSNADSSQSGEPTASDEAQAQALAVVTSVLTNKLEEGLSSTFRLEKVEIQDGVSVSLAIGRNVYLTTQYNIVDDVSDKNMFEVAVEVTLPYRWYLEVGTGDKAVSHVSALRKWRF